jgi:hypothetical protein
MVQVVTLVIDHFSNWKTISKLRGYHLDVVSSRINEFLCGRGYKGKFAAFTIGVLDQQEGILTLSHAGDNVQHFWRAAAGRFTTEHLQDPDRRDVNPAPAAGVMSLELALMFNKPLTFGIFERRLGPGDIFILYTDGIEEDQHIFRNAAFERMPCAEVPEKADHGNHHGGEDFEEFGLDRVESYIRAVQTRSRWRLDKVHPTPGNEFLSFDFSGLSGGIMEFIIALIAVNKAFRLYLDPSTPPDEYLLVDKRAVEFLRKTMDQAKLFFGRVEPELVKAGDKTIEDPNYVRVYGVREDPQFDDLTLLCIRRK